MMPSLVTPIRLPLQSPCSKVRCSIVTGSGKTIGVQQSTFISLSVILSCSSSALCTFCATKFANSICAQASPTALDCRARIWKKSCFQSVVSASASNNVVGTLASFSSFSSDSVVFRQRAVSISVPSRNKSGCIAATSCGVASGGGVVGKRGFHIYRICCICW